MEERDGLIAMHQIQGIGWRTLHKLLEAGWNPAGEVTSDLLQHLRDLRVPGSTVERIRGKWNPSFVRRVKEELKRRRIAAVTCFDPEYPEYLKEIAQPPWVLYIKGDLSLLSGVCLAVVGTRQPTHYGRRVARKMAAEIASRGWVVVSGMAAGVDSEAHRGALEANGKTVAVLGTGVDVVYPKHLRGLYAELVEKGAVCSEMPPGTAPRPGLFPQRNRIISGLSVGTLVVEAAERSGALITADFSMEQGREVFAVPGPVTSEKSAGTNRLIQQGAKCVTGVQDILEEFPSLVQSPQVPAESTEPSDLSPEERLLLSFIRDEPVHIDELREQISLPPGEIHRHLLSLQLKKRIRQLPGSRFVREG
ncbi:MAG: DNA-processing protein DprA [Planifilum fimeticola]